MSYRRSLGQTESGASKRIRNIAIGAVIAVFAWAFYKEHRRR